MKREQGPQGLDTKPHDAPPKTFEEYAAFMQSLEDQHLAPEEFLKRFSEVEISSVIPGLYRGADISPADQKNYSIFSQEELTEIDEDMRHWYLQQDITWLLKYTAELMGDGNEFAKTHKLIKEESLSKYFIEFMNTIWQNRGKKEHELQYPEKNRGEKIEKIGVLAATKMQEILPWFDPNKDFDWQVLLGNLRGKIYGDAAEQIFVGFKNIHKAASTSRAVRAWYQTLSHITQELNPEDFAILFSEAITKRFRVVGYKEKNDPDVIEWHKHFKDTLDEAIEEWLKANPQ